MEKTFLKDYWAWGMSELVEELKERDYVEDVIIQIIDSVTEKELTPEEGIRRIDNIVK